MKSNLHIKSCLTCIIYAAGMVLALLFYACDMIEYHPYDLEIKGERNINAKNIALIEEKMKGKDEFTFAVVSDTQRWYDETVDAVDTINRMGDVDFVIHAGDISDFGLKLEYEKQRDILNRLEMPYVVILGNHDCIALGLEGFRLIFGKENFSFKAGNVRFVCMNTNFLEFGPTSAVPDFSFLKQELVSQTDSTEKTIFGMHAAPFSEQFNNNVVHVFNLFLKEFRNPQFCIYGHGHKLSAKDLFDDGFMYYQCPCAEKRTILRFTITPQSYTYEVVEY